MNWRRVKPSREHLPSTSHEQHAHSPITFRSRLEFNMIHPHAVGIVSLSIGRYFCSSCRGEIIVTSMASRFAQGKSMSNHSVLLLYFERTCFKYAAIPRAP
jgi:hypothetical protein